jgi:hypothetical protein
MVFFKSLLGNIFLKGNNIFHMIIYEKFFLTARLIYTNNVDTTDRRDPVDGFIRAGLPTENLKLCNN